MVFVDYQPPERVNEVLASADIGVVVLGRGLGSSSVPSKLYSILASGRPVIAAVDPGTEVARVVQQADCGIAVAADDSEGFAAAVGELLDDGDRRSAMGRNGRAFVEAWMTPAAVAEAYAALFAELRNAAAGR